MTDEQLIERSSDTMELFYTYCSVHGNDMLSTLECRISEEVMAMRRMIDETKQRKEQGEKATTMGT